MAAIVNLSTSESPHDGQSSVGGERSKESDWKMPMQFIAGQIEIWPGERLTLGGPSGLRARFAHTRTVGRRVDGRHRA
eukprot:scaffold1183_cov418-Prasinococcus_capsulatus_cf.AAC.35